ncbi:MAG: hypothetical protein LIP02_10960 [Bacteroidales bacterium]|nr:hypothetical protein [Bacteroidales bacterium]
MGTTPLNFRNQQQSNTQRPAAGDNKNWTRASLIAAVAAGGITVEAANLILQEQDPDAEPIVGTVEGAVEGAQAGIGTAAEQAMKADEVLEKKAEAQAEDEKLEEEEEIKMEEVEDHTKGQTETHREQVVEEPKPPVSDVKDEDLADVIVEEIDHDDIDADEVFQVTEVTTLYTEEGMEADAAMVTLADGTEAMFVDVDGDGGYDLAMFDDGSLSSMPMDYYTSDAEMALAQEQDTTEYLAADDTEQIYGDPSDDIMLA